MDPRMTGPDGEGDETGRRPGKRPMLAGVEVREEDLEPQKGLHLTAGVVRVASIVVLLLAIGQFAYWWANRPPENVGLGLLVGDTIRLVVFSALLWAAGDVAALLIKTHYDIRAARILLARQTYMMRHMGRATGDLPEPEPDGHRRAQDATA
ncbi:MAG TPA: hypothetical protein VFE05_04325 [Longimicrobiaceae bacterium]|nr:hypothetical protein [Longimicrobiaceae bacterium]